MPRVFDFLISVILSLVTLPLVIIVLGIVWADCRANPLFMQYRVGRNERPFVIFKIRTMRPDTLERPTHDISAAQLTRSGALLRRYKLDELPQLWNVCLGQMAIVGPRPCLPSQSDVIRARRAVGVFALRPGITGLAQIAGVDMSCPVELAQMDAAYLARRSIKGDWALMVQTLRGAGAGDFVTRADN